MSRVMIKLLLLTLLATASFSTSAQELQTLLELKPATALKGMKTLKGASKDFTYEIIEEKDLIKSVTIEFKKAIDPKPYVSPSQEGFCLKQMSGHAMISRNFFFDLKLNRRYELTPLKKLIAIHLQEMPDANKHTKCTFDSFNPSARTL